MFKCVNYSYFKDLESVQTVEDTYPKSVCFCQTQAQFVILNDNDMEMIPVEMDL